MPTSAGSCRNGPVCCAPVTHHALTRVHISSSSSTAAAATAFQWEQNRCCHCPQDSDLLLPTHRHCDRLSAVTFQLPPRLRPVQSRSRPARHSRLTGKCDSASALPIFPFSVWASLRHRGGGEPVPSCSPALCAVAMPSLHCRHRSP